MCHEVIRMGGLCSILYVCRSSDVETLRHCAAALANLSLHGGPENQEAMIQHKVMLSVSSISMFVKVLLQN